MKIPVYLPYPHFPPRFYKDPEKTYRRSINLMFTKYFNRELTIFMVEHNLKVGVS